MRGATPAREGPSRPGRPLSPSRLRTAAPEQHMPALAVRRETPFSTARE
ncbi:hypothetical protein ABIA38_008109 [Embleya sp. AB8]